MFCELFERLIPAYILIPTHTQCSRVAYLTRCMRWDHIFCTGNSRVGRIIASVVERNPTPVTLELGGKSATVVADDIEGADLDLAARRILHGKIQNAGQLCVTPDYVLVPRGKVDAFVESVKKAHEEFWPGDDDPCTGSIPMSRMIHPSHHAHLVDILNRTKGKIVFGGQIHNDKSIAPTILTEVPVDDVLMEEYVQPLFCRR